MAGLIQSPATYDPVRHKELARERRNTVLNAMAEQGYITPDETARLKDEPVKVNKQNRLSEETKHAYFVSNVSRILQDRYGVQTWWAARTSTR